MSSSEMPQCAATRRAEPRLSPVSITTRTPIARRSAAARGDDARVASSHRSAPATTPSTPTHTAVAPAFSHLSTARASAGSLSRHPRRSASAGPPTSTARPSTVAAAPSPGRIAKRETAQRLAATRTAAPEPAITAAATGCDARDSRAHAQRSSAPAPSAGRGFAPSPPATGTARRTSVIAKRPSVSVPVLSTHAAAHRASDSRCAEPLTSMPRLAALVSPHTLTTGVESTSAQGHATTSSTHAVYTYSGPVAPAKT